MLDHALYLHQPYEVSVETLTLCNASCVFCPYETLERKGTEMPEKLIFRLIDEMAGFKLPFFFSPFKVNEPFLDLRLHAICERFLSSCPQGGLRLFTNGSALTPETCRWIADLARVEHLWISLNAVDSGDQQALMRYKSSLFAKIRRHLDVLHHLVEKGEFGHEVVVSRVSQGTPEDKIFMRYIQDYWPRFKGFLVKKDSWLGDVKTYPQPVPQAPCVRWWELSVCADGKVALCCMDGQGKFSLGNVETQTLLEVYNQPALTNRRQYFLNRHTVPICQTCTY